MFKKLFGVIASLILAKTLSAIWVMGGWGSPTDVRCWAMEGDAGTDPATDFLGTTDNQPLEIRVNNQRALRIEPQPSPNIIGGHSANWVDPTSYGAVIAGGGNSTEPNRVIPSSSYSAIAGGVANIAGGSCTAIGGGASNIIGGSCCTIGGGWSNTASGENTTVGGGYCNSASGFFSTVGGGDNNAAYGSHSFIGGGKKNKATSEGAIGGGILNEVTGSAASISGGEANLASGYTASIGGGTWNVASGASATVGGGLKNTASGDLAIVGGGEENEAVGRYATIGGGSNNTASGDSSVVGGGAGNVAGGLNTTVGGGRQNEAVGRYATIGGGWNNTASGNLSTICGGYNNLASGDSSTILGGSNNEARGYFSYAAGRNAKALHPGSFVWGDSTHTNVSSTSHCQFIARASGGVYFYTRFDLATGVYLAAGGNSWNSISDRETKENFTPVDGQELLDRLSAIPIQEYNLKSQDPSIRHIGPVAQDFHAAFDYGESDRAINMEDADGVALAAIQALYKENHELKAQLETQQEYLEALEARLQAVENSK